MVRRIPRSIAGLPIPMFRRGYGWLAAGHLVMLEHRGRVSGTNHVVALEVVARFADGVAVVAGYGPATQWYRNIIRCPDVRVWDRRRRGVRATATPLSESDSLAILERYRRQHRIAARLLGRVLDIPQLAGGGPLPADAASRLPVVHVITLVPDER